MILYIGLPYLTFPTLLNLLDEVISDLLSIMESAYQIQNYSTQKNESNYQIKCSVKKKEFTPKTIHTKRSR